MRKIGKMWGWRCRRNTCKAPAKSGWEHVTVSREAGHRLADVNSQLGHILISFSHNWAPNSRMPAIFQETLVTKSYPTRLLLLAYYSDFWSSLWIVICVVMYHNNYMIIFPPRSGRSIRLQSRSKAQSLSTLREIETLQNFIYNASGKL